MKTMRKFLIGCMCAAALFVAGWYLYFFVGVSVYDGNKEPYTFTKTEGKTVYVFDNGAYAPFEIRGVDMGAGIPGHFATDLAIDKETYLRWFGYVKDMGANTVRVYTILPDDFYEAVYEYNSDNPDPLYILHGLWLNDYSQFSHRDAYDDDIAKQLVKDGRSMIDVLHGQRSVRLGKDAGYGIYRYDISQWVIGYILGVEWEDVTVAYTDHIRPEMAGYAGEYMYTTSEATPFESMLARTGDALIGYETRRYGVQRLVAFSNWPTTDPFDYPYAVTATQKKCAKVDVEHIKTTEKFLSGSFASYHVYPYYPDFMSYVGNLSDMTDPSGRINTYYTYLKKLADYHTIPVVISEYGVPSSRGMAQRDKNTGRNQGGMSETEQAAANVACYRDIMDSGCAGSVLFSWQDEWFKRTWNTMQNVDLLKTPFWSDYQTNEQSFGVLAFDPGEETCVCYVDGDSSEWAGAEPVLTAGDASLYMRYDERFLYYLVRRDGLSEADTIYIPIDTTQKTGAYYCENYDLRFDRGVDFVLSINGAENSRLVVQRRYEMLRAMFAPTVYKIDAYVDPPAKDDTRFETIRLLLQTAVLLDLLENVGEIGMVEFENIDKSEIRSDAYETGKLTLGNANPSAADFNSLADFCYGQDCVEIKLPWELLNFGNASEMMIHDDYYEHYGVELMRLSTMYLGLSINPDAGAQINLPATYALRGWGKKVTYHERLKPAYYALKALWTEADQ